MKRLLLLQLLLVMLMPSCDYKPAEPSCPDVPLENFTLTNELDYEIFNAIITNYYANLNYIHLVQKTEIVSTIRIEILSEKLAGQSRDSLLLDEYSEKNKDYYFLSSNLLGSNVRLMNSEELDCFLSFENSEWEKYYQKYPDSVGFFKFSRPGVNNQGDRAIVEYCWYNNYLAAMGYLVILEKIDSNWIITDRIDIWAA